MTIKQAREAMAALEERLGRMPGSRELCYQQPDGTFDDADAHAAILDNPEAERTILAATRARLIALGEDPALVAELYPDP